MKFTISILALNNLALTKRCIASVLRVTSEQQLNDMEIIVTDNGSSDGTAEWLKAQKHYKCLTIVTNEKNLGFIEPNRKALEMANGEYFVMLNNDAAVPPAWLEKLESPFIQFPGAALSGPDRGCSELQPTFHGKVGKFEYLEGACLMGRTSILRKHGLFSKALLGAYGEDSDLSLRMRELGYTLHRVSLLLPHARGATSAMVPQVRQWQDHNHAYLRRRWSHYLKVRTMDYPIVVRRADAWGDVLLTTPIIRAIKKCRPMSPIWVETNCTDVFRDNPHVARCERHIPATPDALSIQLNMSYENMTETHILDAYIHHTRAALGGEFECESRQMSLFGAHELPKPLHNLTGIVAIHAGPVTWRSKEWGAERFDRLSRDLWARGFNVVLVGAVKAAPIHNKVDLRGLTNLQELATVIKRAALFIGVDSFPLHVAQAMGTPAIGIFGITSSKYILTAPNAVGVNSDAETAGLRHRVKNSKEVDDGGIAISKITIDHVLAEVDKLFPK